MVLLLILVLLAHSSLSHYLPYTSCRKLRKPEFFRVTTISSTLTYTGHLNKKQLTKTVCFTKANHPLVFF